ncbi:hypothetical protein HO525_09360 [Streptococcus suis]|nr:hypothetical protein [Streptococcus suis]
MEDTQKQSILPLLSQFGTFSTDFLIMTTRQTGGLNKGYKPTSPASA